MDCRDGVIGEWVRVWVDANLTGGLGMEGICAN